MTSFNEGKRINPAFLTHPHHELDPMMLIFLARTHETNIDPGLIGRALAHQLEKTKRVARVGVEMDAQMVKSFGRKECDAKCSKRFIESNKKL